MGDPACRLLNAVGQLAVELGAASEAVHDGPHVFDTRHDEDLRDVGPHELPERVVEHGLSADRQEVLVRHARQRVEPRALAACEDDALHCFLK